MKQDIVISIIHNYGWDKIYPYVVSLDRSGFTGRRVMFTMNVDAESKRRLHEHNFETVDYQLSWGHWHEYGKRRFAAPAEYLRARPNDFRYVIWTDITDVVFQSNPSEWLEHWVGDRQAIIAADMGGWCIRDGGPEDQAARQMGPEIHSWLRERPSYCSGTIAGDYGCMLYLMLKIAEHPDPMLWDECYFNYLMRVNPCMHFVHVPRPEDGWTATLDWLFRGDDDLRDATLRRGATRADWPVLDEGAREIRAPKTGVPYAMVHQYNRSARWTEIFREKYR
jgi:hypothetical protein